MFIKKSVFDAMRDNPGHWMPPALVQDLIWDTKYTCDEFALDKIVTVKVSHRHEFQVEVEDDWTIAQVNSEVTRLHKNDVPEDWSLTFDKKKLADNSEVNS